MFVDLPTWAVYGSIFALLMGPWILLIALSLSGRRRKHGQR